jgi:hypothetical protein
MSAHGTTTHREPCGCVFLVVDVPDDQAIGQGWTRVDPCRRHARDVCEMWEGAGATIHHCQYRPGHTVRHRCPCGATKAVEP